MLADGQPSTVRLGALRFTTLAAYTRIAYMTFIELRLFTAFRERYWTDGELGELQDFLTLTPAAGDVIPDSGGLRKVRWRAGRRGKRGGARVIYYWDVRMNCVYLLYGYVKAEREDLSRRQLKAMRALLRDLIDG